MEGGGEGDREGEKERGWWEGGREKGRGGREGEARAKPGNQLVYYIKLQCPFVCLCCLSVCLYPFRHDGLTATTFGTHMRIDLGIIRTQKTFDPSHPRGLREEFGDQKYKSSGNVMNCPEKN